MICMFLQGNLYKIVIFCLFSFHYKQPSHFPVNRDVSTNSSKTTVETGKKGKPTYKPDLFFC